MSGAIETGKAISAVSPICSILTLQLYKGTEMLSQFQNREFELLSQQALAQEV